MRTISPSRILFALGLAGLGVLSLLSGDFALNWQPVPAWIPWREVLARLSGGLLLAGGLGMLVRRTAILAARAMMLFMLSWVLLLQVPRVLQAPLSTGMWIGFAESSWLFCGGWILLVSLSLGDTPRAVRLLFGVSCLILGLSHFVYADTTAGMVPAWIPGHYFFAYLTGAGHAAAGMAILSGVLRRLAATAEAAMVSCFVLLLHIPAALSEPGSRLQWTMVFVATALAGSAWAVAESLRREPWGWPRQLHAMRAATAD